MKIIVKILLLGYFAILMDACEHLSGSDSNSLGGNPKTGFTNVGDTSIIYLNLESIGLDSSSTLDIVVTENNNGYVTWRGKLTTDTAFTHKLDTLLGTAVLPLQLRRALRERLVKAFNVLIDSTDKNNIKVEFQIKAKVTSEGIQDFIHSNGDISKPFTLVKYSANVGEQYSFVDEEGNQFIRKVTYRSIDDDYDLVFWRIKIIKVEESIVQGQYKDVLKRITYYTNHKFGLVGVEWTTINGKVIKIEIWPPNLGS